MVTYAALASAGMITPIALDIKANDARANRDIQWDRKPDIDDVICQYIDGEALKNALNFINYIRESKMKIKWSETNVWSVRYKGKHVLDILVSHGSWRVRLAYDHVAENSMFSKRDAAAITGLIGAVRNSSSLNVEPATALS